jgi:hypothetical protein
MRTYVVFYESAKYGRKDQYIIGVQALSAESAVDAFWAWRDDLGDTDVEVLGIAHLRVVGSETFTIPGGMGFRSVKSTGWKVGTAQHFEVKED